LITKLYNNLHINFIGAVVDGEDNNSQPADTANSDSIIRKSSYHKSTELNSPLQASQVTNESAKLNSLLQALPLANKNAELNFPP
jgi:hypothetical protein